MKIDVLNAGSVELVRWSGGTQAILDAARICFGTTSKGVEADAALLKSLFAQEHTSPMEHCTFTFQVKAPIFVLRQWMRHRIGCSYNERSLRFCEANPEFFIPDGLDADTCLLWLQDYKDSFGRYLHWMNYMTEILHYPKWRARELTRSLIPFGIYSEVTFSCNAASLYHFLKLRSQGHAQNEIKVYANAMLTEVTDALPELGKAMKEGVWANTEGA